MSEYQYYEFVAVDAPVLEKDAPYPYEVSSRAEVTPWRWRNVYNFGDFRGSVLTMLEYYDAHIYVTNWGSFNFMLALPNDLLDQPTIEPYLSGYWLQVHERAGRTIIAWSRQDEEPCDGWIDGEGLLDRLLSIRDELVQGDFRTLYLGWLAGLRDLCDWDWDAEGREETNNLGELEPPVPPGLGQLTSTQRELADELNIDPDLLRAAAELDVPPADQVQALQDTLATLSCEEMRDYLLRVANGEGNRVKAELNRRASGSIQPENGERRTAGALLATARDYRNTRLRQEREEKERRQREMEAKRQADLTELLNRADSVWRDADRIAEEKTASAYNQVANTLQKLRDAYAQANRLPEFHNKLNDFRQQQARRPALLRRLATFAE